MQRIFFDTRFLDAAVREKYDLSEDLMMENAAASLEEKLVDKKFILILCGGGNNGGDGYVLARRLCSKNKVVVAVACVPAKSPMCLIQKSRAEKIGVRICGLEDFEQLIKNQEFDSVVDCIFGSGFHGFLPTEISNLVEKINSLKIYKLACDIPSGLDSLGNVDGISFDADETVTMGALKLALFSDAAKDICSKITVANLGISRDKFEDSYEENHVPKYFLLDEEDCNLPFRKKQNVNKGNFGHACVVGGEKIGAGVIASCAALRFGSGLVTLVDFSGAHHSGEKIVLDENGLIQNTIFPYEIMCGNNFPTNTTAVALGMGLGRDCDISNILNFIFTKPNIPVVFDADIFYHSEIKDILKKRSLEKSPTVLTPHPKEFSVLLEKCGLGKFAVTEVVCRRIELVEKFCNEFPEIVLLLKGATVVIGKKTDYETKMFFNPHGTSALSKAGSGDVLAGMIAGLMAQKIDALESAKTSSLVHGLASKKITPDFSLTPFRLLEEIINFKK